MTSSETNSAPPIRVAVCGAAGRMGREVVRAVIGASDMALVAAIDAIHIGCDCGELAGAGSANVLISSDLQTELLQRHPHVMVDFTVPATVEENALTALSAGVAPVIGTTGLTDGQCDCLREAASRAGVGALIAPNFAIGAVLMMEFAARASVYLPAVEIIELHHDGKLDAPSGTALLTASRIAEARELGATHGARPEPDSRGLCINGVHIHSVRLPGLVAHQEVILGGAGQTLSIRHDSMDRSSFMPGVLLAIRKVLALRTLVVGLDKILD